MSLLLAAAPPTPEPGPGWGVEARRPAARTPLGAAILVVASLAYAPEAIAAPVAPDVPAITARVLPARPSAPARPIAFVDPTPTVVVDPGGWYAAAVPTPWAAAPLLRRPPVEPIEAGAAVQTPPAAGQAVPTIALAGRTTIIPRLTLVEVPAAPQAPTGPETVLAREPAALRPVTRPRTLDPLDGAHAADPGGWALVSAPPPPRAVRPPVRAVIDAPEAPAAPVTPPAAGQAVPTITLAGRTTIVPRTPFVDAPAAVEAPLGTETVLERAPAARLPVTRPRTLDPIDGAHRADPGGWPFVLVRVVPARRPLPSAVRGPLLPETPAAVVQPPAAGAAAPSVALARRGRVIPRQPFVPDPPVVAAPPGPETVLVREPARRRPGPLAGRLPIVAPDPRPGGLNAPEVLSRRAAARRPLPLAARLPIVPVVVVAEPDRLAPTVHARPPAKRRPVTRPAGSYTDQGIVAPPTVFDCLHVSVVGTWPRTVPIAQTTPEVTVAGTWPRVVPVTLDSPTVTVAEAWPRVVDVDGC